MPAANILSDENLALRRGAYAIASVTETIGQSQKDIDFIRTTERPWEIEKWCDTYDGVNPSSEDWWAIVFPEPLRFNMVEFVHGPIWANGGWWTSLTVQVQREPNGPWLPCQNVQIYPSYDFTNRRGNRRPYETYVLTFEETEGVGIRLYGKPGGSANCTSVAKMAVYHRDLNKWSPQLIPPPPVPRLFQLLEPGMLWDVLRKFHLATGILLTAKTLGELTLEIYLDEKRFETCSEISHLWINREYFLRLLYDSIGWEQLSQARREACAEAEAQMRPIVRTHHGGMAEIAAPIIAGSEVLGFIVNFTGVFCDSPDLEWHRHNAYHLGIDMKRYFSALERIPVYSREQLEAIADLLGMLMSTIADLIDHIRLQAQQMQDMKLAISEFRRYRQQVAKQAIEYMTEHLSEPIKVEDIARSVALSPSHFYKIFKDECGKTPNQYLRQLRLEKAKYLLQETNLRVIDICAEVGYERSTLYKLFKRTLRSTPRAYANSQRGE